ncbi:hypothetical protein LguiA_007123 [Lonicera macranthoides]
MESIHSSISMTSRSTQKSPKRLTGRPRRKHNIVLATRYRGTLLKAGLQRFILLKLTNNFWRLFRVISLELMQKITNQNFGNLSL